MKVLLVEDDKKLASFIKKGLKAEGFAVDLVHEGVDGLHLALTENHDVIILDIMLPGVNGLQMLEEIRKKKISIPVILVTAKDTIEDKVQGLNIGADDYLVKPFAFAELLARVRALLRRDQKTQSNILEVSDLKVELASRKVTRGKKEITLTPKEFSLLEYFMRNVDQVITRTMISEHVWDMNFDSCSNVIDVYVNYLRNKIDHDFPVKLIQTIKGVGYVMKTQKQ